MADSYFVEIVEYKGDRVEKRMGPVGLRQAERIDGGVNINLNHKYFYTRIVPATDDPLHSDRSSGRG